MFQKGIWCHDLSWRSEGAIYGLLGRVTGMDVEAIVMGKESSGMRWESAKKLKY